MTMAIPILAYSNHFENASSVSASSEATGYPKENAYDWRAYTYWKPTSGTSHQLDLDYGSAVSADCVALAFHNLDTLGATVTVHGSTDNFSASDVTVHTVTLNGDAVCFETFTTTSYRYWRINISLGAAGQPYIGAAFIGAKYALPHGLRIGYQSIYDNKQDVIVNNIGQNGNFIGRTLIKQGIQGEIKFEFMTATEMRGNYRTFIDHARTKPFFFNWNPGTYDADSMFLWLQPKGIRAPHATQSLPYYEATVMVEGVTQ